MTDTPITNTKAISAYFGRQEGETLKDFLEEIKALSADDKDQLGEGIRNGSLTY